jgi:hypothetical protein
MPLSKSNPSTWPRLSETLPKKPHPILCGNCESSDGTSLWIEHDNKDAPQRIFICLCRDCSDRLIEAHPRLYSAAPVNAPLPGAMALCNDCSHRKGLSCSSREAKFNGGTGLTVTAAKPMICHMDGHNAKTGKRWSRWLSSYSVPPSHCSAKSTA